MKLLGQYLLNARGEGGIHTALDRFCSSSQKSLQDLWESLSPKNQQTLKQALKEKEENLVKLVKYRELRLRGLITARGELGELFGRILKVWLEENLQRIDEQR